MKGGRSKMRRGNVATGGRFEDLEVWQGARALVKAIYQATGQGAFGRDFGLRDQVRRAAVSVMSNIAEGFERNGDREFRHFLLIAKALAGEVRSSLYVARDLEYVDEATHAMLTHQATSLGRQTGGFIKYLEAKLQQR
jgi:four helix bundle protein